VERGTPLQLIRRFWLILCAGAILGGVAAHVAASRMAPTYLATVSLLTGPINADFDTQRASGNIARTYADLATSGPVLRRTIARTHVGVTPLELRDDVSATSNDITRIVTISVENGDRDMAARLANTIGRQLFALGSVKTGTLVDTFMADPALANLSTPTQDSIRSAASHIFGNASAGKLSVVDPAIPPTSAIAPRVSLITLLGVVAGLMIVALLVFLREATQGASDVEEDFVGDDLRVLGAVPARRGRHGGGLVVGEDEHDDAAEAYRLLATKLAFGGNGAPVRSLVVVDAASGKGTGEAAANLAAALAEIQRRVVLIDATDVRAITKLFALDGQPGYAELVNAAGNGGEVDPTQLGSDERGALRVIPAGASVNGHSLNPARAALLLKQLQATADMVVISTPPTTRSSGALVWARVAEATLLVLTRQEASREIVDRALENLSFADANVIGTVLRR
jgi:non-specific protein-tyrosine kinase